MINYIAPKNITNESMIVSTIARFKSNNIDFVYNKSNLTIQLNKILTDNGKINTTSYDIGDLSFILHQFLLYSRKKHNASYYLTTIIIEYMENNNITEQIVSFDSFKNTKRKLLLPYIANILSKQNTKHILDIQLDDFSFEIFKSNITSLNGADAVRYMNKIKTQYYNKSIAHDVTIKYLNYIISITKKFTTAFIDTLIKEFDYLSTFKYSLDIHILTPYTTNIPYSSKYIAATKQFYITQANKFDTPFNSYNDVDKGIKLNHTYVTGTSKSNKLTPTECINVIDQISILQQLYPDNSLVQKHIQFLQSEIPTEHYDYLKQKLNNRQQLVFNAIQLLGD